MTRLLKIAAVALVVGAIVFWPRHLRALTCIEQYEINADAAYTKAVNCVEAAMDNFGWYNPERYRQIDLCSLEFASNAIENAALYAKCMAIDVFLKYQ